MNSMHDMGGMHGFEPIEVEQNEPVFHHPWKGHVYALRGPSVGSVRATIEGMHPAHYLATSYYEKWLWAKTQNLLANGVLTQAELDERIAFYGANLHAEPPRRDDPVAAHEAAARYLANQAHIRSEEQEPEEPQVERQQREAV